jgi:sugar phosphate isomerase/epimerase
MNQIKIGTCIQGKNILSWLPHIIESGFESMQLYYNVSLEGTDFVELAKQVNEIIGDSGVEISSIGLYCNPIQYEEQRKELEYCIDHAHLFNAKVISTFAGALEGKSVYEAMPHFKKVFGELTRRAEANNVKIGIENCPMYGFWYSATSNIGFCPAAWEMMFNEVPSESLGLEWEPSHQLEQLIDPIPQLKQWLPKIVHIHGKDASIDMDMVRKHGILSNANYCQHRTPGFGDTDWRKIISILRQGGYESDICIEGFHDPVYSGDWEMTGQLHALQYLKWCRGGEFIQNPWDCK